MPTPLIGAAAYPAIRAAIDTTLDATVLPDATIALDIFLGAGIRDVLDRDPLAEGRTGAEMLRVQNAAVYFTAARLIKSVPLLESEAFDDYRISHGKIDRVKRAAELVALAEDEVSAVLTPTTSEARRPTFFTVASRGVPVLPL